MVCQVFQGCRSWWEEGKHLCATGAAAAAPADLAQHIGSVWLMDACQHLLQAGAQGLCRH